MDKAHPLSSSMVVRSLDVKKDAFRPCEKSEELLGPEISYLSAIGAVTPQIPGVLFYFYFILSLSKFVMTEKSRIPMSRLRLCRERIPVARACLSCVPSSVVGDRTSL